MLAHLTLSEVGILAAVFFAGFGLGIFWKGFNYVSIKLSDPKK